MTVWPEFSSFMCSTRSSFTGCFSWDSHEPVAKSTCSTFETWFFADLSLGMATGRVRAGFFHTRARPASLDPRLEPGPISKRIFFAGPRPTPPGPVGSTGPVGPRYFRAHFVAQIFFFFPNTNFLSNQTRRGKRTQENPDLNISETNKNHYFLSNQQIGTRIIKIALKLENTNLITIENTIDRNKNHYFSLQYFPTSKVKTRINI